MKKLSVMYLVSTLKKTGPTNVLYGIVDKLDRSQFEPVIYTLSKEPKESMREDFERLGIRVESFGKSRIKMWAAGNREFLNIMKKETPDVLHTHCIRADQAMVKGLKYMKKETLLISTLHSYFDEDYVLQFGTVMGKLVAKKHIKLIRNIDKAICCSTALSDKYYMNYGLKLPYINNGVDIEKFKPVQSLAEKKFLRRKLGLPEDVKIFIVVGGISKGKDPLTVIKAFEKLEKEGSATLLFLGKGDLEEICRKEIGDRKDIIMGGHKENVAEYLRASDVYISASLTEGLPNAMLEAGAVGLEMIVSNIPQQTCIFKDSNCKIEMFCCGDSSRLKELVEKKIKERRQSANWEIAHHIETYFSSESMSKAYQKIYRDGKQGI